MITEEKIIQQRLMHRGRDEQIKPYSDALATIYLVLWFAFGIYMVLITLGLTQFSAREASLKASSDTPFAVLEQKIAETNRLEASLESALFRQVNSFPEIDRLERDISKLADQILSMTAELTVTPNPERNNAASEEYSDKEKAAIDRYNKMFAELNLRKAERDSLADQLEARKSEATKPVLDAEAALTEFKAGLDPDLTRQISDFEQFTSEKNRLRGFSWIFFGMPQEIMTLVLTLSMGVFGSTIALARQYFQSPRGTLSESLNWFLLRPILGAVMALSIYILFKAGVLVFSAPQTDGGVNGALNPFVIALLGIIAGLFSEQAYSRLDRAATELFRSTDTNQPNYWASGIEEVIEAQNKSIESLATFTGETSSRITAWVTGEMPVPADIRAIISRWLGKEASDLFKIQDEKS